VRGLKFSTSSGGTSVDEKNPQPPVSFDLKNCYPNPFNPTTLITYQLAKPSHVRIMVFDITGREVTTLVSEEKPAGSYSVSWNASNNSSGVYFYKLTAGNYSQVRKMVLVK